MHQTRQFLFLIFFLFIYFICEAQNYQENLKELYASNDTAAQSILLLEWETKAPKDPELYVAYFNHYVRKSKEELISLDKKQRGNNSLQLQDSTGDIAGYMNSQVMYNDVHLGKAFEYIQKGIATFPNRLDMRFGQIYLLGQNERYDEFTRDIILTLEQSSVNKNAWLWADNKPVKDPKNFMLDAIQEYIVQLYNTNDLTLLENMRQISFSALKFYPDHVESLSNLSVVYLLKKQYDKALEPLLKAEKLAPKDAVILSNIAQAYKLKEDYRNAISYYEMVIKYGDAQAKSYSKEQIEILKKK